MKWLMPQSEIDRLEALFEKYMAMDIPETEISASSEEDDPLDIVNGIALIKVEGVLTPKKLRWLSWFGEKQTVYSDIERKVREAEAQHASRIMFAVNSPGGDLEGLYETMRTIADTKIPTETVSGYLLASAAYMLASQTGSITAKTEASLVGSVGVVTTRINWGETVKEITNTDSPKKRPDVGTKKGVKAVQEELDDIYQIFAEMVAAGRGVTIDTVKKRFGEGAVMTARTARQKKMIDAISVENKPASSSAAAKEKVSMNRDELKAEHPGLYNEVFEAGKAAAKEEIVDCLGVHAILAEQSGDYKSAVEEMKTVTPVTGVIRERHYAKRNERGLIAARQADNPDDISAGGKTPGDGKDDTKAEDDAATAEIVEKYGKNVMVS